MILVAGLAALHERVSGTAQALSAARVAAGAVVGCARAGRRRGAGGLAAAVGPVVDRGQCRPVAGGACDAGRGARCRAGRCHVAARRRRRACLLGRRMRTDAAVLEAARRAGLLVRWTDVAGVEREVAPDVLRAVLEGLQGDAAPEHGGLRTACCGQLLAMPDAAGAACWVDEHGAVLPARADAQGRWRVPDQPGYWQWRRGDRQQAVAVAPQRAGGRRARCAAGACRRRSTAFAPLATLASVTAPAVHDGANCCTVTAAMQWR